MHSLCSEPCLFIEPCPSVCSVAAGIHDTPRIRRNNVAQQKPTYAILGRACNQRPVPRLEMPRHIITTTYCDSVREHLHRYEYDVPSGLAPVDFFHWCPSLDRVLDVAHSGRVMCSNRDHKKRPIDGRSYSDVLGWGNAKAVALSNTRPLGGLAKGGSADTRAQCRHVFEKVYCTTCETAQTRLFCSREGPFLDDNTKKAPGL